MKTARVFTKPEGFDLESKPSGLDKLYNAWQGNLFLEVEVSRVTVVDGERCWEIDMDGAKGLIPFGESGLQNENQMSQYPGMRIYAKVVEIDPDNSLAALSRKIALDEMRDLVLSGLEVGQTVDGIIKGVGKRTAYVDIGGGVTAEMPFEHGTRSQLTATLRRVFSMGEQVQVQVVDLDKAGGKITVSRTALLPDPWARAGYQRRDIVAGTVARVVDDMVFVEIKEGLVALAPAPTHNSVSPGDRVQAMVVKFDRANKKLHLRIRQLIS